MTVVLPTELMMIVVIRGYIYWSKHKIFVHLRLLNKRKSLEAFLYLLHWERVMRAVGLKNSSNKKGKGRVVGINASQGDPIDISEGRRMSISEGTRMNFSQGSRMNFSQWQGQIRPASPSTPTSKPSRSPPSVVGRRKSSARKSNFKKRNKGPFQFLDFVVQDQFPPYMKNYIDQCTDVLGDGNCEFRAVALAIYGSQDEWVKIYLSSCYFGSHSRTSKHEGGIRKH
ncbi:hypothetical protein LIER_33872 [Lithospermum erythrorhizon]|uniref:OTU domain-containing protein n=1 Tax=Lithospermum erythrorhizon TaxID=34254 RepID=A0AAV3S063_LITER